MEKKDDVKGTVCVTGASGFLASWLIKMLLESGYHVRGTVRDPQDYEKTGHLLELEGAKERLHLFKADLLEEGSFDEAVMGCEGVFHIASPVASHSSDPKTGLIEPAVKGTLNVLRSCKKNTMLKKVVFTSSIAAVARTVVRPDGPLDENSWSNLEQCEKLKLWYPISKILAEQAAWDFAKENNVNLVTVIPSWIIGPSLARNIRGTAADVLSLLKGRSESFSSRVWMGYVHLDDAARCHILAYEDVNAQGRYICSSVVLHITELAAILAKRYPWLPIPLSFNIKEERLPYALNASKAQKLGVKFKGIEEMFDDCIESLKEQGHLP